MDSSLSIRLTMTKHTFAS